jgi:DNA-binding phage protein
MLFAALGYLREYRTYAHIAADFGIAESNLFRTVRWVGNT